MKASLNPSRNFESVIQNGLTRVLPQFLGRTQKPKVDIVTNTATYNLFDNDCKMILTPYDKLSFPQLTVGANKLLIAFISEFTKSNHRNSLQPNLAVSIPLEDYVRLTKGPDVNITKTLIDNTRKKIKRDLDILFYSSFEWTENRRGESKGYMGIHLLSMRGIKNGIIFANFTPEFAKCLLDSYVMTAVPNDFYAMDERNPNAYSLAWKLITHNSIDNNQKANTANILNVGRLLKSLPDIPTVEEVLSSDRHITNRIIDPFEAALDSIPIISHWEYCSSGGAVLPNKQAEFSSYEDFANSYIKYEIANAPDHKSRIQTKQDKQTKKKKATTAEKK